MGLKKLLFGTLMVVLCAGPFAFAQQAAPDSAAYEPLSGPVEDLIWRAGNANQDATRLAFLREIRSSHDVGSQLSEDLEILIAEVEKYVDANRGNGHIGKVLGDYDPDAPYGKRLPDHSPLKPIEDIYGARAEIWIPIQSGSVWYDVPRRERLLQSALARLQRAHEAFPRNDVVAMYVGHPTPWPETYEHVPEAPEWANLQREALSGVRDIVHWWVDHRQRGDGSFGGGWGDDCEMWRWWAPVLLGFQDSTVVASQDHFARGMFAREEMSEGYLDYVTDVEHAAEDFTDTVVPMLLLHPEEEEWMRRAKSLQAFMTETWMGRNEQGQLQFKSTYISADSAVTSDTQLATDTPYHVRVAQPAFVAWLRTGDPALGDVLTNWMDTWVDATASSACGKPSGIIPAGIHWPEGRPCGVGEDWWQPMNHPPEPSLYQWPSAVSYVLDGLLMSHHMTDEEKYLSPIRSMADIYREYHSVEDPLPGSPGWAARQLGSDDPTGGGVGSQLENGLAKYRSVTGDTQYDSLLTAAGGYSAYRINGYRQQLVEALRPSAQAVRQNWEAYTSEVRWTDRVLNLPAQWMSRYAPEYRETPDTDLLFNMVTGNTGQPHVFPTSAVRWLTPPEDIAALVTAADAEQFSAELFHFGTEPRPMTAEFYLLDSGKYKLRVEAIDGDEPELLEERDIEITGPRSRVDLELPPRRLCRVEVTRQ